MHRQKVEMAGLLPLLLLSICCVSAAATQAESETEIIPTKPAADDPSVQSQQQSLIDIKSTLGDISVQLAELKGEVKHWQRQTEEHSATLRELELQNNELKKLQRQFKETQAAELDNIKTNGNNIAHTVQALRNEALARQVAFSASLVAHGQVGYPDPRDLIFKNVLLNRGNHYKPTIGVFIAPWRGVYHFEFHIHGRGNPARPVGAWLMKNNKWICAAYERQASSAFQASNSATVLLQRGDRVFVRQWPNSRIFDNGDQLTTFSGHLLFTVGETNIL